VIVLHISDLHFGAEGRISALDKRKLALDALTSVLGGLDPEWCPNVVCLGILLGRVSRMNITLQQAG
jgi:hypothetical protein